MKKPLFVFLILMTLILSACSGQTASTPTTTVPVEAAVSQNAEIPTATTEPTAASAAAEEPTGAADILNDSYENALPVSLQLVWGTFKLNGTDLAITQEQAASLFALWTSYQSTMPSSGPRPDQQAQGATPETTPPTPDAASTETDEKLDELVSQIEAVMTTEQLTAIADMKITNDTAQTIMQEQGIEISGPQGQGQGGPGGNGADQPQQGEPPAGGDQQQGQPPSGDAPDGGNGGGQAPSDMGAGGNPMGNNRQMLQPGVLDALLKLLANISADPNLIATAEAGA